MDKLPSIWHNKLCCLMKKPIRCKIFWIRFIRYVCNSRCLYFWGWFWSFILFQDLWFSQTFKLHARLITVLLDLKIIVNNLAYQQLEARHLDEMLTQVDKVRLCEFGSVSVRWSDTWCENTVTETPLLRIMKCVLLGIMIKTQMCYCTNFWWRIAVYTQKYACVGALIRAFKCDVRVDCSLYWSLI
jgi:hypothetical protein